MNLLRIACTPDVAFADSFDPFARLPSLPSPLPSLRIESTGFRLDDDLSRELRSRRDVFFGLDDPSPPAFEDEDDDDDDDPIDRSIDRFPRILDIDATSRTCRDYRASTSGDSSSVRIDRVPWRLSFLSLSFGNESRPDSRSERGPTHPYEQQGRSVVGREGGTILCECGGKEDRRSARRRVTRRGRAERGETVKFLRTLRRAFRCARLVSSSRGDSHEEPG